MVFSIMLWLWVGLVCCLVLVDDAVGLLRATCDTDATTDGRTEVRDDVAFPPFFATFIAILSLHTIFPPFFRTFVSNFPPFSRIFP